jgi:DNA segregation ATPase FtsK/SpoIIIE, S-DNA-T family
MAQKNGKKKKPKSNENSAHGIPGHTKRGILAIAFFVVGIFLTLAAFNAAGIAGTDTYWAFNYLFGFGYFLLPIICFILTAATFKEGETEGLPLLKLVAAGIFVLTGLAYISIVGDWGGLVGKTLGDPAVHYFDVYAALVLLGALLLGSLLIVLEGRISPEPFIALGRSIATLGRMVVKEKETPEDAALANLSETPEDEDEEESDEEETAHEDTHPARMPTTATPALAELAKDVRAKSAAANLKSLLGEYTPPPLSLLERDKGRPGVGDIKGNANLIKRTLSNFGIVVELDEISIGPSVTRYAIKPAEGVRLSKIISLQTNLELALAAHPVRIEAPIPGKSLVGIEVPNSAKVTVGLGTLLEAPAFADSPKPLLVGLGRDIAGGSHFANVAKMPHMLIAGATGSGKSVTIHTLITSLIYRCGPQQLRFLMVDPKRVELTLYNKLPHLLCPVITDPKKAIMALRWAGKEMERRYTLLEEYRVRDIESYHQNILTPELEKLRAKGKPDEGDTVPDAMPYIVVVIDELADIMQSYPRELEAAVVRLAQMSRAVGIHLVLSTQRPSVNVITGLIKANVPSRLALQVASQIDSRTILDQGGAEKLLGAGDMLYLGGEMNKPIRLQSAFIGENEVKKVVDFIAKNNDAELPIDIASVQSGSSVPLSTTSGGGFGDDEEIDDDMYEAARGAVIEAGKASTSYLQRKLRVGYARAARLIDVLEERGVIGPGDGAKPREVLERSGPAAAGVPDES